MSDIKYIKFSEGRTIGMFYRLSDGGLVRLDCIGAVFKYPNPNMVGDYIAIVQGDRIYLLEQDGLAIIELLEKQMGIV